MLQTDFGERAKPLLCIPPMPELFPTSCKIYRFDGSEMKPSQSPQLGFSEPAVKQGPAKGGTEKRIALQGVQRKLRCCRSTNSNLIVRASDGNWHLSAFPKGFWGYCHGGCGPQIFLYLLLLYLCSCEWHVIVAGNLLWQHQSKDVSHQRCAGQLRAARGEEEKQHTYSCR